MLTRETFLNRKPTLKTVTLEADGQGYTIRKLSQADVREVNRDYSKPEKSVDGLKFIVCRGLADEDGVRILADADLPALDKLDFDVVKELAAEIADYSGIEGVKKTGDPSAKKP